MRVDVKRNQKLILKAISKLNRGGEPININRVSKITGLEWHTVKKYFTNNFYIKD
jgi:predicted transcriptional regulator